MRRREFLGVLGGAAAAWPLAARAQQRTMPLVAVLSPTVDPPGPTFPENIAAFLRGMRAKGYIDGQSIKFEFRFAGWSLDQLPRLAAELVALRPDVLFTHTTNGVLAAKAATKDIPIVIGAAGELVERGVIQSLARPGGNITGLTLLSTELDVKRIEILKRIVPTIRHVAILVNPNNPSWRGRPGDLLPLTSNLVVNLSRAEAASADQIETAFMQIATSGGDGVLVENDALFSEPGNRRLIADIAKRYRLPTIAENRLLVDSGVLLSYGASIPAMFEYAANYVDKIVKGAKPADLPVEQPTKFVLAINSSTAKVLALNLPPTVLAVADEVIE
jgi:putative tryptophan/tyrosine transport system substrate-binding protein